MASDQLQQLLFAFSSSSTLASRFFGGCFTFLRFANFNRFVRFYGLEFTINLCNLVLHLLQPRFSVFASLGEAFPLFFHHFFKRLWSFFSHGFSLRIRRNSLTLAFL